MDDTNGREAATHATPAWLSDSAVGASLGVLLGILVGLSASPIVAGVASGLVALLAGLFGLTDKTGRTLTRGGARRIVAFAMAAAIAALIGVIARTHDWLAPSVKWQRDSMAEIGIADAKEQNELLRFVRFGILPKGMAVAPKDSAAAESVAAHLPFLYAGSAEFCSAFLQLTSVDDRLNLMKQTPDTQAMATIISNMPAEQRDAALTAGKIYLCKVR
jgi:hypothetical protein